MSGKLLDETGLAEVWRKVQQRSIPVKGLSQNDYDSLDGTEKQKDVLYICTPTSGGQATLYYKGKQFSNSGSTTVTGDTYLVKAPVGTIVIWSGTADNIPSGWHLCDGEDGTPDLRDKFVLGAGETHPVGEIGGEEEVKLTESQMPVHNHRIYTNSSSGEPVSGSLSALGIVSSSVNNTIQKYAIRTEGSGGAKSHPNMPPYYALCYIMKITADETDGESGGGSSGSVNWTDIHGRPDLSNLTTTVVHQVVLLSSLWVDNRQTVKIDGILADELPQLIIATPLKADSYAYYSADIIPESQEDDALVFHADTVPEQDISVIVRVFETAEIREEISGRFEWWSPKMTSDDTPEPYHCFSGAVLPSTHKVFRMFDGNRDTICATAFEYDGYFQFDFGSKTFVSGMRLVADNGTEDDANKIPKVFLFEGSNDGTEFDTIYRATGEEYPTSEVGAIHDYIFKPVIYRYYRLVPKDNYMNDGKSYYRIMELEFYKLEETT